MAENLREMALDVLLASERGEDFSHRLVAAVLDKYDYLDESKKAFFKRLTEGTMERQLELDYYLDHFSKVPVKKMRPFVRCLMRMSVYQLIYMDGTPDSAVCNEACRMAGKRGFQTLKGYVNGTLRALSRNKQRLPLPRKDEEPLQYLAVRYSMPAWITQLWLDEYGFEITETLLKSLLEIHPVSLRFDSRIESGEREELCRLMAKQGAVLKENPYLPWILHLEGAGGIRQLPGFLDGKCTVQDAGAALAVEAAQIGEKDIVIDVCAAPGGKSILASERARMGKVIARDVSEEKVALIEENIHRMRAQNITVQVYDGRAFDESLSGKADVVLLDVPCSGLGVTGKKRDIKYHATREGMESLLDLQREIVRASAGYVRPGGTILYSTCTISREENEEMVKYLVRELGFEPVSLEGALPQRLLLEKRRLKEALRCAGKENRARLTKEEEAACIQLLPGYMQGDGFFIARLRRKDA